MTDNKLFKIEDSNGNYYFFDNGQDLVDQINSFDPEITAKFEAFVLLPEFGYIELCIENEVWDK